jgi:hypothetical protein
MCHHYESTPEWEVLVRQALERKEPVEEGADDPELREDAETREEPVVPADD